MFSLIIVVVSVALAVALVLAAMYYGGSDTLFKGKQEAEIAQSLNELSQLKGALTQYHAETGASAANLSDLVPVYLGTVPNGWGVAVPSQVAFESIRLLQGNEEQKLESCREINRRLGITSDAPQCADIAADFSGCCVAEADAAPPVTP